MREETETGGRAQAPVLYTSPGHPSLRACVNAQSKRPFVVRSSDLRKATQERTIQLNHDQRFARSEKSWLMFSAAPTRVGVGLPCMCSSR